MTQHERTPNEIARDIAKVYYASATNYPDLMNPNWGANLERAIEQALTFERQEVERLKADIEAFQLGNKMQEGEISHLKALLAKRTEALDWVTHLINGVSKSGEAGIHSEEWDECNKTCQEALTDEVKEP